MSDSLEFTNLRNPSVVEKNIIGKKYDQDLPMWRSLAAKDVTP
jgi:hypothetical protein